MCRWGFSNIVKTLKSVPDDRVRAYIVWLPIFGGDFKGEARKLSNSFRDKRVNYFLDPESETGKQWERVLNTERLIAWDVYLLYGPDAKWKDDPPIPDFWMHQLGGVTKAPVFDQPKFTTKLKGMLDEMKTPPVTSQNNGRRRLSSYFSNRVPAISRLWLIPEPH